MGPSAGPHPDLGVGVVPAGGLVVGHQPRSAHRDAVGIHAVGGPVVGHAAARAPQTGDMNQRAVQQRGVASRVEALAEAVRATEEEARNGTKDVALPPHLLRHQDRPTPSLCRPHGQPEGIQLTLEELQDARLHDVIRWVLVEG